MENKTVVDKAEWIPGREAMEILGWTNLDSVRTAARQRGAFRWRKKGNGHLVYHRDDVLEYRQRRREATAGVPLEE